MLVATLNSRFCTAVGPAIAYLAGRRLSPVPAELPPTSAMEEATPLP